jgi:molecular chaperone GrpE
MAKEANTPEDPETIEQPTPPVDDVNKLNERIVTLEKQNDEFLRHLADLQNRDREMLQVMKRKDQDLEQKLKFSHEKFAADLLLALDNLERAVDAAGRDEKNPLVLGVKATMMQIGDVLKRHGISPIEALGQPFDPEKHQAIQSQPVQPGQEPGQVTQVVQQGYTIHNRVLRPAMVVVAQ